MKHNQLVTVNRNELATGMAAILGNYIIWNEGRVSKIDKTTGRVKVKWDNGERYWFDADQLNAVECQPQLV